MNFALTGAAGFVAPRHLKAIQDTGHRLVAATDPHDAVGVLDRYSFDVSFFTEYERFDRHLEKLRRGGRRVVSRSAARHRHQAIEGQRDQHSRGEALMRVALVTNLD